MFASKKPGVVCIEGQLASLIGKIDEIQEKGFEVWESYFNNQWTTFIKNPHKSFDTQDNYIPDEDEYMSAEESKHWEMDAWEYDGHPDDFDDWREGKGY